MVMLRYCSEICTFDHCLQDPSVLFSSSPGQSPGRAMYNPWWRRWQNVKVFTLKFFMRRARRCQASYPVPVTGLAVDMPNL